MKGGKEKRPIFAPRSEKQRLILNDVSSDVLLCGGGAGGSKAERHGEKVLTPTGFVNIEDIKVGDAVIGPDNKIQYVTKVSPQGLVDIYRVTFQDGRTIDACKDHLWQFHKSRKGLQSTKVADTLELKRLLEETQTKPIVPLCEPLDLYKVGETPIDPYSLGALLGDGNLSSASPTISNSDTFIIEKMRANGTSVSNGSGRERDDTKDHHIAGIRQKLRDLGLYGAYSATKFIPIGYKTSSIEDRFQIIQGMMDTDGNATPDGKTYYTTASEQMADDMTFILQSLGFTVTKSKYPTSYTKDGIKVVCQNSYKLYIRGKYQQKLFSLPRKQERTKVKEVGIRVDSVELICQDYATCISITGEDKLYITTNFIVTHNSYTCLMKALKYVQDPAARVVIVRESYPTLKLSGGLWDESQAIYSWFGGVPKVQRLTWVFKNGATIQFAALPDNIKEWQGLQASHILVDESASFKESDILFLLSRLRSAKYKGHLNLTMTCNPDNASFLFKWVEYCLDEEGIPKEGTEDIIRWFVNMNGNLLWGSSKQELFEKYGQGKTLGVDFQPMSFRFIPLTVYDNPVLMKNNPTYLSNLLAQPLVDQQRYLHGSWTAKDTGSMYFNRDWVEIVESPPVNPVSTIRAWDFAGTEKTPTTNPDFSVGVKMSRDKMGIYYIEDVVRIQARTDKVLRTVVETAIADGTEDCSVCIPVDPAAAGKTAAQYYMRVLAENGVAAKTKQTSGQSSKMIRFRPFCALAESRCVKVVRGEWNDAFFNELENYKGVRSSDKTKDDQVDAVGDAFVMLSRQLTLPTFSLPNLSQPSPIPRI